MIGKQVGNYRMLLQAGEDNLGVVYQATHVAGGFQATVRHFAVQFTDVQAVARYLEIARTAGGLNQPGIWQVRESVWNGRNAFIAGEPLATGETLDVIMAREGRLWPELVVKLGWQLASSLGTAHSAGMFHCRLDGDSVYCYPEQDAPGGYRTKIMDFGVSAFLEPGPPDWRNPRVEAFGLPYYMPPEQCRGGMIDFRGDVYSLGCLLYHMATGRPPFVGGSAPEIASAHQMAQCPSPHSLEQSLPYEVDSLIMQMLMKEPAQRPAMPQIAYELERIAKQYWTTPTVERTVQLDLKIGTPPPPTMMAMSSGEPHRRSLAVPLAAMFVAMLGAGVTVAVLKPWKKKAPAPVVAPAEPDAAPAEAVKPPEPPPPKPAPPPPPRAPEPTESEKQLALAKKALTEEKWADATAAAKALQKLEPKNADAAALIKAAKVEPQNRKVFDELLKAAGEKDPEKTTKALKKIPPDSMYYPRGQKQLELVQRDYMHVKKAEAKALAETKSCAKIAAIEKEVRTWFPDSAPEIAAIAKTCGGGP